MRHRHLLFSLCLMSAALLSPAASSGAAPAEPIVYTLRFPAPHTHYVEVEAVVPAGGRSSVELMMAVWTPGSYLVREYSRHVEALVAEDPGGHALRVAKTRKNRWRVDTGGAQTVRLRYRVYARQMQVQANWVEDGFAILNGAATFITPVDALARPHEVQLVLPAGWTDSVSGLPATGTDPDAAVRTFRAADFDTLADSPIVAGTPTFHAFDVRGVPHVLANVGEAGVWDGPRSARDGRIPQEIQKMSGAF